MPGSSSERAVATARVIHSPNHPDLGWMLFRLSTTLRQVGEGESARVLIEEALEILENALGPSHPMLAVPLIALGTLYRDSGRSSC